MRALLVVALLAGACDRDPPTAITATRDLQPPRRIIEPPTTGVVRQLPPHAIRSDGVGPYKLGDKVAALLQQLPSGPRIMRFELPGIVRTSVFRAEEDDAIVIGGETASNVTFVAVVGGSEVARTEKSNVHVGSTLEELERALGPLVDDPDRARDPRLAIPSQQRNLRFVVDAGRITAIVVTSDATSARTLPEASCVRPPPPVHANGRKFPACLTQAGEVVEIDGDEVTVRSATGENKIASIRIPNLLFAEPLRHLGEGRDEIVAITSIEDAQARRWSIVAYRLEGTRFVRSLESEVIYEMTNARTRWIGAELRDVQLFLELTSQTDGIEVGGLLTTQSGARIRDVAVISPVRVGRKSGGKSMAGDASSGSAHGSAGRTDAGSANP
ncbi:MAG: hypothetical protein M4D80_22500 [Myxococcota bacterium]|nr:hypothetical protein [Myxococcota bacterium]